MSEWFWNLSDSERGYYLGYIFGFLGGVLTSWIMTR